MTIATVFTYAFALFVAALIPGPGMTALVARALGSSLSESLAMAAGIMLGDILFLTAAVLGLAIVAQTFSTIFLIIKYAGVAYLAWLAFKTWTLGILRLDIEAGQSRSIVHSLFSGLFVTLGNPKTMLFYVALVPTLVDFASLTPTDYIALIGITILVLISVTLPYILLAAKARALLRKPAALRRLNRVSAGFLAITASYIAIRAN